MEEAYIGSLVLFAGNFAPRGWAFCQGQLLPINQHQALFSILGTTYGGDGRTNFALPDLRGRVPVGTGHGQGLTNRTLGQASGTENVILTQNQMPLHTHTVGNMSIQITNPGFVDVPVNTEGGEGNSTDPTNILSADGAAKSFTKSIANDKYSGKSLPVKGLQVSGTGGTITPTGGNQPFSIVQPNLGLNYIICLHGIYPQRD
jgi:microcystin-dependent protein